MPPSRILILDLNGVAVSKVTDKERSMPRGDSDGRVGVSWILASPALGPILDEAARLSFSVFVWTSSTQRVADAIVDVTAPGRITAVLAQDFCEEDDDNPRVFKGKNWAVIKDLRKLWGWLAGSGWATSPETTLIVDDSSSKLRRNPPGCNAIIPTYEPRSTTREAAYEASYRSEVLEAVLPRMRAIASGGGPGHSRMRETEGTETGEVLRVCNSRLP